MRRKWILTILLAATLAFITTGCESSSDGKQEEEEQQETPDAAALYPFLKVGNEWKFDHYDDRAGHTGEIVGYTHWRIRYVSKAMVGVDLGHVEEYEPGLPHLWWWTADAFCDEHGGMGITSHQGYFPLCFKNGKPEGYKWSMTVEESGVKSRIDREITSLSQTVSVKGNDVPCVTVKSTHYWDGDMVNPKEIFTIWYAEQWGIVGWKRVVPGGHYSDNFTVKLRSVNF